ncbi:uncharacterized protein LOC120639542 [Panicum virgatum]|uniref:Uncharacterized protein n=1 Tax=Panicum virgatum TaxID=38727 RepID=A0A8T0QJ84_PANVG|nr:uncharacterized protein LOC120639542 [Panicum virgatum]KAG2570224.1 hypothetical protein PVAP13_7KG073063 [Panicum virgatum]
MDRISTPATMAPGIPPSSRASRRGEHAAAAITISSGSVRRSVINVSDDDDEVTSRRRSDPMPIDPLLIPAMAPRIPPSFPASRRGKHVAAAIATINLSSPSSSDDEDVMSRPRSAARRTTPPSSVSVVVLSPRRAARPSPPASPAVSDGSSASEATTIQQIQPEKKKEKEQWCLDDELFILWTMAWLRMGNPDGKVPLASEVLKHLVPLRRRGVHVRQLSDKMWQLKVKFKKSIAKAVANGGKLRRRTRYRHLVLYNMSQQVWPDLYQAAGL